MSEGLAFVLGIVTIMVALGFVWLLSIATPKPDTRRRGFIRVQGWPYEVVELRKEGSLSLIIVTSGHNPQKQEPIETWFESDSVEWIAREEE